MRAVSVFGLGVAGKLEAAGAGAGAGAAGATLGGLGITRAAPGAPDEGALGGKGGFLRNTGGGTTGFEGAGGTSVCDVGGRGAGAPGTAGGRSAVPLLGG